ncbi:hypothetical protein D9757_000322 [Collybiopsis confluens]|uniref:General negative regulator of transcription subunit n=1 Tax=Collybiopsis confluens TaxID=2823264 RepID=A0A8H5MHI3_9AGAR|nr:hypothetical protein D9757_000322 [Collybiopsis confluens]
MSHITFYHPSSSSASLAFTTTSLAMAARKLQTEIDRTLKRVSEGVEYFESVYEKMQASSNQTQKEKLELDLKTQIKKLQRMRDQIKTWITSNDIKDKSALVDNRKLIETVSLYLALLASIPPQMEKFKACEKEMKTKAFSKEGLTQAAKLDPKEQEREEIMSWLQLKVEELQLQIEQAEAEIESLPGKKRSKSSSVSGRTEELEALNERRKWHIGRLEIVLRLLSNGSLGSERAVGLKDDVAYFVESNTARILENEEDFDEYEGIYDELNLDEEEEKFRGLVHDDDDSDASDDISEDLPPRTPSKKLDDDSTTSSRRDTSPILKKATTTLRKSSVDAKSPPISTILKSTVPHSAPAPSAPPPRPPAQLPPIRYAAAAAAAIQPPAAPLSSTPTSSNQPQNAPSAPSISASSPQASQASQDQASVVPSSPSLTHPSVTSPMLSSAASVSQQPDGSFYSSQESPAISEAVQSPVGAPGATSSPRRPSVVRKDSISSPKAGQSSNVGAPSEAPAPSQTNGILPAPAAVTSGPSPLPQQVQQYSMNPPPSSPAPTPASVQVPQFPPGVKVNANEPSLQAPPQNQNQAPGARPPSEAQQPRALPGSLSDLVVSFESAKQKAVLRMNHLDQVHKLLEGGLSNLPQPQDTERPKYYVPRNPFSTPAYYPQTPNVLLSTPAIFAQLDVETLFYVFYYHPGTYQQYLAAKELKRQSWRFHVKYLTWFQRHSEPQAITEEYEQGVYVYFDWEGSWCQRKKADFRFEYRYLSED